MSGLDNFSMGVFSPANMLEQRFSIIRSDRAYKRAVYDISSIRSKDFVCEGMTTVFGNAYYVTET
jgi:hypothetical protein